MGNLTPMMEQYMKIKAEYKDAFLFYRLGDFYEMFYDDAVNAARELEITLTKRGQEIPMCGVPYHSASSYIKTLIDKGYKVAICEQVEDPRTAKGVVKREVIQLITPGTIMDSNMLQDQNNNYIASLSHFEDNAYVIVYHDLSTGESNLALVDDGWDAVMHELYNQPIKEIVVSSELPEEKQSQLQKRLQIAISYQDEASFNGEYRKLCENLHDHRLLTAFSRLLNYLLHTQKRPLNHLQQPVVIELQDYLSLDMYSKRNLELTESLLRKKKHGTLLWVLDRTVTAMGTRMLKKWLERPLLKKQQITYRLDIVSGFHEDFLQRDTLRETLKTVYDLERLAGRVSFGNVNAKDLIQLKQSLEKIPAIKETLQQFAHPLINKLANRLNTPEELLQLLQSSIVDDPPLSVKDGGIIKNGYHNTLDKYRDASNNGKQWIAELEQREKQETGIKSLKIGFNRVFGYYIEVTKSNLPYLSEGRYERKQTLANAERFITPELKEKEQLILEAEEKSVDLEYELFVAIREAIKEYIPFLQGLAEIISEIDVLQCFATVSEENNYKRPQFTDNQLLIKGGRHPVVEKVMVNCTFVPNDVQLDSSTNVLLITGPNMSGKSTYMRQLALTIIMGQIGCYVPADEAELIIFDQIFTRIGAADDLVSGQSTFMVEMLEANHALQHATDKSLILLDEIGRGTSTYDGMALAQAIVEYIHDRIHAKTLFSTHYHELTTLQEQLPHLKNIHVRAEEHEGSVVFLHQIMEGAADKSYGIQVAQLADLPDELIARAAVLLVNFEKPEKNNVTLEHKQAAATADEITAQTSVSNEQISEDTAQLSFFPEDEKVVSNKDKHTNAVVAKLKNLDLFEMTPMDAMNALYDLQKSAKK